MCTCCTATVQETLTARCSTRKRQVPGEQSESALTPQDESLTSETEVYVTSAAFSVLPSQAEQVSTETQVADAHHSSSLTVFVKMSGEHLSLTQHVVLFTLKMWYKK